MAIIDISLSNLNENIFLSSFSSTGSFSIRLNTIIKARIALIAWQIKVAQATPEIPILKAATNKISTPIFETEEIARKINGVFESPRAVKIPVETL